MKKFVVFALILVLVSGLLLSACATQSPEPGPSTPAPSTPSEPAPSNEVIELTMSYHAPPQASLVTAVLDPWAKEIEESTGGRVKIIQHGAGSLLGADDAWDGMLSGICDIAHITTASYPGQFPLADLSDMPRLYPNTEVAGASAYEWMVKNAADKEFAEAKLLAPLPMAGQQYIGNKEVKVLEDFKGMNLRGAGKNDTIVIELLDAKGVALPTGDVFSALDTGMIDGLFFAYSGVLAFGLKDVTKYRADCALYQPVHYLCMNRQVYEGLPADIKQIFDEASSPEVARKWAAAHAATEIGARKAIEGSDKAAGNPPIYVVPPEELARWDEIVKPMQQMWIDDVTEKGLPGQELYDDLKEIIKKNS